MRPDLPSARWRWVWPVLLAVLIVVASGRSQIAGPDVVGIDKVTHFFVFGLLATLVCRLESPMRVAGMAWIALVAVSAFGALDEWHQSYTPGRSVEVGDWIADTVGAACAVIPYAHWSRYRTWLEWPIGRNRRVETSPTVVPISGT